MGFAGTDEKCRWLEDELGFDKAINYKSDELAQQITDATPDGVDLYFENTGGPVQHITYGRMNEHGRIIDFIEKPKDPEVLDDLVVPRSTLERLGFPPRDDLCSFS